MPDRSTLALSHLPLADLLGELGKRGDCRNDPELHTGPDAAEAEPAAERQAREDVAREVCESCPVWDLCLEYALRIRPTWGVWAGYKAYELAALRRQARQLAATALTGDELAEVA